MVNLFLYFILFFTLHYSCSIYSFETEEEIISQDININNCEELNDIELFSNSTLMNLEIDNIMHIIKHKAQPCIDMLINNGKFGNLDYYLTELSKRGIQFREFLQMSINNMRKNLDDLHNKFRFDEAEYQTILPAFQWAQSLDDIFIELKFAHRHDTPGCLEMKDMVANIDERQVLFSGHCVLGDIPIKIEFKISMWKEINITESTHGFGSVGRYQFTLKKKMSGMYWDKLLQDGNTYSGNMRVWFEMKAKYEEKLKQFEEQDEEDEFKREVEKIEQDELNRQNEIKSKKKNQKKNQKKKRKKKITNKNNTDESKKTDL